MWRAIAESNQMERRIFDRLLRVIGLAICVGILSGCASRLYADVTSYQKWPANAMGQTYHIVPSTPQQAQDLEFQAIADMVRANIGVTGLVELSDPSADQTSRFTVHVQYANPTVQVWTQRYADHYYPWFSPYAAYYHRHFAWGGNMFFAPPLVTVPMQAHQNTLTVWITDRDANDAEVYRATATHLGQSHQTIAVMPYLAQAIFDDFPGNNGRTRQIQYTPPE